MFIVLVGPDCAGKSTIAEKLGKAFNLPVIHNEKVEDQYDVLSKVIADINDDTNRIFDRWQYPDDIIYRRVCGADTHSILTSVSSELEKTLCSKRVLFLYVSADTRDLTDRFISRGDADRTLGEILHASQEYDWFFALSQVHRAYITTSRKPIEQCCQQAIEAVKAFYQVEPVEEEL